MTSREQVQDYVHGYPLSKDELHRRSGVGEVAERHFYSHPHTHLPNNVSRNTKKKTFSRILHAQRWDNILGNK